MDRTEIGWILLMTLVLGEVAGWWLTLFLWVIPTVNIALGEILSLTLWSIIAIVLFFSVWAFLMVLGAVFLLGIIFA